MIVRTLRSVCRDERGLALPMVIALSALMVAVSISLTALASSEATRSQRDQKGNSAYQAAEAGVSARTSRISRRARSFERVHGEGRGDAD